MLIGLLRYAHVIELHRNSVLNMAALSTGWICAAGLIMVGNFQVTAADGTTRTRFSACLQGLGVEYLPLCHRIPAPPDNSNLSLHMNIDSSHFLKFNSEAPSCPLI